MDGMGAAGRVRLYATRVEPRCDAASGGGAGASRVERAREPAAVDGDGRFRGVSHRVR